MSRPKQEPKKWDDIWESFKRTKTFRLTLAKDIFPAFWKYLNKKYPKGIKFK